MILYHAPSSYYSMIARLALTEAGVGYDSRPMDIHFAKEQLADWYVAINPHMTVPALVDGAGRLDDSGEILAFAATRAGERWLALDAATQTQVNQLVKAHYDIVIEQFTFTKLMIKAPPLRWIFPRVLTKAIADLERRAATAPDGAKLRAKAQVNRDRLAYFTTGPLTDHMATQRAIVKAFIDGLPRPAANGLLFGDRPTAADIVTAVLLGRLKMVGEWSLTDSRPDIAAYFDRLAARPAFAVADIWTKFSLPRFLLRR